MKRIVVIAGPTASGKTNIALKLAKDIGGYIINGDSRQVYKYLDIGTAKPVFDRQLSDNIYILNGIRHYLFNIVNPKVNFTLFEYQRAVKKVISKTEGIPILVGGSGLYIDSVVFNYILTRNDIKDTTLDSMNVSQLQQLAKEYLPLMSNSDRKNKHRLIRAIQRGGVYLKKGKPLSHIYFVMDIKKDILEKRVKERIELMFKDGLLEENISLLEKGYTYEEKGMNSIGYIEFKEYFKNNISLEEVKENIFKNTMSYIKRQRTWFKRNKDSIWVSDEKDIYQEALNFISRE
jgi:tRNA dimethylallyltransferase